MPIIAYQPGRPFPCYLRSHYRETSELNVEMSTTDEQGNLTFEGSRSFECCPEDDSLLHFLFVFDNTLKSAAASRMGDAALPERKGKLRTQT